MSPANPITRLRSLRTAAGWTINQLAVFSATSIATVSKLELATTRDEVDGVTIATFRKIAQALGVKPLDIYPGLRSR